MLVNKNTFNELIKGNTDYSIKTKTYSPFYSTIGLILDDNPGIGALYLNYNRSSRMLWKKLLQMPFSVNKVETSLSSVVFGNGEAKLTFYDTDSIYFCCNADCEIVLFSEISDDTASLFIEEDAGSILLHGFSKNPDDRDPDENVPFTCGVKIHKGDYSVAGKKVIIQGAAEFSLTVFALDYTKQDVIDALEMSPMNFEKCEERCLESIKEIIGEYSFETNDNNAGLIAVKALNVLVQNFAKAQGNLRNYVSTFPNRGTYPSHFLWDSFFINLATEMMNTDIARDAVLLYKSTQRSDGKYGQFLCSTWMRPGYTQPALMGRAALRLYEKTGDKKFASDMAESLAKNNEWWLTARRHFTGLICCPHGLETGQDDAPRFDNGTTISADMNSYLLDQMRCTAVLFDVSGSEKESEYWRDKADNFAEKTVKYLYCKEDGIFYDIHPETLEYIKVKGTSCFMPLWAGVPLEKNLQINIIKNYLLNPEYMFGDVPFPSVAYNDSDFIESKWWRGPMWLPMAYFMMQILKKYGFRSEYEEAKNKLLKIITEDGRLSELFNSKSGEGLGSAEQGWTAAIYLYLITE